ncbi:U3 small nucleolar RNA-associated protein 14, putative (UTP14) [Plasmodium ovale wallikeri]|uniref:U3 small nucleolar RNA-associated protein 14, putative n=2 Tax=Plasmodium ovale TaxID=36330 RepID=A0A1C3KMJ5_PLAOA|nr:U3 small nucleolar RNA-associated protein 14, putative (UTP14) [Plasmodium ovale wallikeri]SBT31075.1 U3 small nucleolar RNA-associated protein 14, putative (UTP14) [Plasmodium ovale wallikeri]SBT75237.1 U3 small nucleolar RNA-associated protein 14, putative [Plasmodium ovale]
MGNNEDAVVAYDISRGGKKKKRNDAIKPGSFRSVAKLKKGKKNKTRGKEVSRNGEKHDKKKKLPDKMTKKQKKSSNSSSSSGSSGSSTCVEDENRLRSNSSKPSYGSKGTKKKANVNGETSKKKIRKEGKRNKKKKETRMVAKITPNETSSIGRSKRDSSGREEEYPKQRGERRKVLKKVYQKGSESEEEREEKNPFDDIGVSDNDGGEEYDPENFIQFLRNYKEEENKKENTYNENEENDTLYKYLPQKDDVYKVNKPDEKVDIDDILDLEEDDILKENIYSDLHLLKRVGGGGGDDEGTHKRMSVLEEDKMNSHLMYIKNIDYMKRMNWAYNHIQNSWQVTFGNNTENNMTSDEFLNKNLLRRKFLREKDAPKGDTLPVGENRCEEVTAFSTSPEEEVISAYAFEEEMKKNLEKSKMLLISDDILKSEKDKKKDHFKKIAQLKAMLVKERRKHNLRKHIKSKAYRRYIRIKERKEDDKIWDQLHLLNPDVAKNISIYEQEYAKKRNLRNDVKRRKTVKLLNRYKNDELKKEIMNTFRKDKEDKNILRKILEKTIIGQDVLSERTSSLNSTNLSNNNIHLFRDKDESYNEKGNMIHDDESTQGNDSNSDTGDINEWEGKKKLRKEMEKRNLMRFSFVKNAEERKKNDAIGKQRKELLNKLEEMKKGTTNHDPLLDSSDDETNAQDSAYLAELAKEVPMPTQKEITRARKQLKDDTDLANRLRRAAVLDTQRGAEEPVDGAQEGEAQEEEATVDAEDAAEGLEEMEKCPKEPLDQLLDQPTGGEPTATVADMREIDFLDGEEVLKPYEEKLKVYNFENNTYENYVQPNEVIDSREEEEELLQLSDSERVKEEELNMKDWCNYNTLLEREKNRLEKEKKIIEKKKNIPLHTINILGKKDKKFEVYYVDKVPYPYDKNEYEKTLNINLNKEMNDMGAFKKLVAPHMTNKVGNIIAPLPRNPLEIASLFTLRRRKSQAKL